MKVDQFVYKHPATGQCMSKDSSNKIIVTDCKDATEFHLDSSQFLVGSEMKAVTSEECLNVPGTSNGSQMEFEACDETGAQKFIYETEPVLPHGQYNSDNEACSDTTCTKMIVSDE